jgi:hypothetical protein
MPPEEQKSEEENLLSGLMKQISGGGEGEKSSSFPVTMVLLGVVVLIISLMGIKLALAKRQAAKLAVQVRRTEEEKKRVKEKLELSNNSTERQAAQEEIQALGKEVLGLKAKIVLRQSEHRKNVDELKGLTSWDDIVIVDGRNEG